MEKLEITGRIFSGMIGVIFVFAGCRGAAVANTAPLSDGTFLIVMGVFLITLTLLTPQGTEGN